MTILTPRPARRFPLTPEAVVLVAVILTAVLVVGLLLWQRRQPVPAPAVMRDPMESRLDLPFFPPPFAPPCTPTARTTQKTPLSQRRRRRRSGLPCPVGMSMGARKRAARRACYPEETRRLAQVAFREQWNWDSLIEVGKPPVTEFVRRSQAYARVRAALRIGERLRPCSGCPDCDVQCPMDRIAWAPDPTCNGSGLLPARKQWRKS